MLKLVKVVLISSLVFGVVFGAAAQDVNQQALEGVFNQERSLNHAVTAFNQYFTNAISMIDFISNDNDGGDKLPSKRIFYDSYFNPQDRTLNFSDIHRDLITALSAYFDEDTIRLFQRQVADRRSRFEQALAAHLESLRRDTVDGPIAERVALDAILDAWLEKDVTKGINDRGHIYKLFEELNITTLEQVVPDN